MRAVLGSYPTAGVSGKKTPLQRRAHFLKHKYGITLDQYAEMLEKQRGACAICEKACEKGYLSVDHDHTTGEVRGLLCSQCNKLLGFARDRIDILATAVTYLEREGA